MKKLTKLALLLFVAVALTACDTSPAEEKEDSKKEEVKLNEPLFSQETIDSLTEVGYFGNIGKGNWRVQDCIVYNDKTYRSTYSSSSGWDSIYEQASDEEKAKMDSWSEWKNGFNVTLPLDEKKTFYNMIAEITSSHDYYKDDMVVCEVIKTTESVIKRFLSTYSWEGDVGTRTDEISVIQSFSSFKDPLAGSRNLEFKTNSSKTKFYATKTDEDGNIHHYYIIKD